MCAHTAIKANGPLDPLPPAVMRKHTPLRKASRARRVWDMSASQQPSYRNSAKPFEEAAVCVMSASRSASAAQLATARASTRSLLLPLPLPPSLAAANAIAW